MRYLLVGDIHLADRPPASCTDTYLDDLFDLLSQTVTIAEQQKCDRVVWAGDVFHYKHPSRTSHSTVQRLIEVCSRYEDPVLIVPGNHDLQQDRLGSIFESQPLGVLFRSGAAEMLAGWLNGNRGLGLYGVPWQQHWETDQTDALSEFRAEGSGGLLVTHAPLYPPGLELPYEFLDTTMFARDMGNTGAVYYGHIHEAHGVYEVEGVTFCNHGALTRGSLHEASLKRELSVTVADVFDDGLVEFTRVPLQARPAAEVYRLVEIEAEKDHKSRVAEFVDSLGETVVDVADVSSIASVIHARTDVSVQVREKAVELVMEQ